MREVERLSSVVQVTLRGLREHKQVVLVTFILLGCMVAFSLIKSFVQPANAMSIVSPVPLGAFYGDDTAYYCARYGLHGSSIAALCQEPQMAVDVVTVTQQQTESVHPSGCAAYDSIFRRYDWNVSIAEAICQAESGGNPRAVSLTNDYGLMQLHDMAIFDPSQNIAVAYWKYQMQGWGAWTTYNTGAYAQFF